jgi:tetratricopeptide (TPR) repeat protein
MDITKKIRKIGFLGISIIITFFVLSINFSFSQQEKTTAFNLIVEGNQLAQQGALKEAYNRYTDALSIEPDNPLAYLNRAQVLFQMWKYVEAIEDFDQVIELTKGLNPGPYLDKGQCYAYLGDFQNAIKQWNICISLEPNSNNPAYLYRGCVYHIMGDPRYKQDYETILQYMPSDAYFYNYIASILTMNMHPDIYNPEVGIEYATIANEQTGYMDVDIVYTLAESNFQKSRNRETQEYDIYYVERAIKLMDRIFDLQGWLQVEQNGYYIYRYEKMLEVWKMLGGGN